MLMALAQWTLLVIVLMTALFWAIFLLRASRSLRSARSIRAGLETPGPEGGWPLVTIIVPAHNEERDIEACARSLLAQAYPNLAVIFVLDRCTDATAERLRKIASADARVTAIEIDECPPDWAGKTHAAYVGAQSASAEPNSFLLFTDADTVFDPQLVHAAVGLATAESIDLVSLLSSLTKRTWFERIVQPVCSIELLRMYPPDIVNRPAPGRAFANGQFLLFSRRVYDEVGGHNAVHEHLLEDLALARATKRSGGRIGLFRDGGMLHCAMYESFAAFKEGWKRIFLESSRRRPPRMIRYIGRNIFHAVEPLVKAGLAVLIIWKIAGDMRAGDDVWVFAAGLTLAIALTVKFGALGMMYRAAGLSPPWSFTHALGALVVASLLISGVLDLLLRRPVRWGGREYVLEPRYE